MHREFFDRGREFWERIGYRDEFVGVHPKPATVAGNTNRKHLVASLLQRGDDALRTQDRNAVFRTAAAEDYGDKM